MKHVIFGLLFVLILVNTGFATETDLAQPSGADPETQDVALDADTEEWWLLEDDDPEDYTGRSYLFIHDTSINMRRRSRIAYMQASIRAVLEHLPLRAFVGLRAFGHRFPIDGPDVCEDTDIVVQVGRLNMNQEDIEGQLRILSRPLIGGGAPVGLALKQGIEDLANFGGSKEIYLYLVDLLKCPDDDPIELIKSACQVNDLHLNLVGFGLRTDLDTLYRNNIHKLGCVDIINVITPEEAEVLPNRLLTRLSVEFRNAEGTLVDPAPGDKLLFQLSQRDQEGNLNPIQQKVKDQSVKGTTIETVGLNAGTYFLDVTYQGQKLRSQQELLINEAEELREAIQLGKLIVSITDSNGSLVDDQVAHTVKITITDAGKPVRTATRTANAAFDLLPGKQYKVLVSYHVGGKPREVEYDAMITIEEGNHQNISVSLPLGAISGKVVDMAGAPAQNVELAIKSIDVKKPVKRNVTTDENGIYLIPDLEIGTYELSLNVSDYKKEQRIIPVIGGQISTLEDMQLFQGIEIAVTGVSGANLDDAEVTIVQQATEKSIPVIRYQDVYRNAEPVPEGEYQVAVRKANYESVTQDVIVQPDKPVVDLSLSLAHYITVQGTVFNSKGNPLPDARVKFYNQQSTFETETEQPQMAVKSDGSFEATVLVTGTGDEKVDLLWRDRYNQEYVKTVIFTLPSLPQSLSLGAIRMPINGFRLTIKDILEHAQSADTIFLAHHQTGQSRIQMIQLGTGEYESPPLLDGDYTLRVSKQGYQEIEQQLTLTGGEIITVPVTLLNYVNISGAIVDGKGNRVAGVIVKFEERYSQVSSLQSTGKDGRFQATLLVKQAQPEQMTVQWISPSSGKTYQLTREIRLPGTPISERYPMDVGEYQLPVNFIRVEVQDVSRRGLSGVQVTYLSSEGDQVPGVESGGGIYESLDLPDGRYTVTISKAGYKEHVRLADVTVGSGRRDIQLEPVILPHYTTVTGRILNGKDEGVPNVEIIFSGERSEQLERCRTDYDGQFTATLLVTESGTERWQAIWKRSEYSLEGSINLPVQAQKEVSLGDLRLPANVITVYVEDIGGNALSGVTFDIVHADGTAVVLPEVRLEEVRKGTYQIMNLPDGTYIIIVHKPQYESGKQITLSLSGGEHARPEPIRLGHYVTVTGTASNGRREPVEGAVITFKELCSTLLPPEAEERPGEPETPVRDEALQQPPEPPLSVATNAKGQFTATLLVTALGMEQIDVTWNARYLSSYQFKVLGEPGTQQVTLPLPINFIDIRITDIAGKSLSGTSVTLTHQTEKNRFPLSEVENGVYASQGLPDGSYEISIGKERYESLTDTITVQNGEIQTATYRLSHYVTVKGHVTNGKHEGLSGASIYFGNLKTATQGHIVSGTNGAFEADLLVKESGRETCEISWIGKHGTYARTFWIDMPSSPELITLSEEVTRMPINFISLEVKSVAATGVAGATVRFSHQESGQTIIARDFDNGNYEAEELPDGTYNISVTKSGYQTIALEGVVVANGEHKSNLVMPKFPHYITMSGVVLNGKNQGVPGAVVSFKDSKRLQEWEPMTTREDGSFTLQALVTDVGTETIEVVWNEIYSVALPISLPSLPDHIPLANIKLPINFITVNIQTIFGKSLSGVTVAFLKKEQGTEGKTQLLQPGFTEAGIAIGTEVEEGVYESPALPDYTYLLVARKNGYIQQHYPEISVKSGMMATETLTLPHLVTIKGKVTNGKDEGVSGVKVLFGGRNSQASTDNLETDKLGYFSEQLLVTGTGTEMITLTTGSAEHPEAQVVMTQEFELSTKSEEQRFENLRLPINFIPIRVQDVSGRELADADVMITAVTSEESLSSATRIRPPGGTAFGNQPRTSGLRALNLGNGRYEGTNLKAGTYRISAAKEGYEIQARTISVSSGEVATEVVFVMPHYVMVKGVVTDGKATGVTDAVVEFDAQNSIVSNWEGEIAPEQRQADESSQPMPSATDSQPSTTVIKTDTEGYFKALLLVKKTGMQRVRVVWNNVYVKHITFPLPETPDMNYALQEEIRLPINYAPIRVTNVLGEGIAGITITLGKTGEPEESKILARSLGGGLYEARALLDGVYELTVHKEGYQRALGTISVHGGEQAPEQQFVLPHFVTVQATVVNGKGVGVDGATITLTGLNSQLADPEKEIVTDADGSFKIDLLVTGASDHELREHLEISWAETPTIASSEGKTGKGGQPVPFGVSHDFLLPEMPGHSNLGILVLPANFAAVAVQDSSGKALSGAEVVFASEHSGEFVAKEFPGGFYEGQNLPNGTYTVRVSKKGYKGDQKTGVQIGVDRKKSSKEEDPLVVSLAAPLTFQIPYYVDIEGVTVDGKGNPITSKITLELSGSYSRLLPESVTFDGKGMFKATLLVNNTGRENLQIAYAGEYGLHTLRVPFILPAEPETVNLQRLRLSVNYIPIEVRDLLGYGITDATVTLSHLETGTKIASKELENGRYEGQYLLDGAYTLTIAKEGYKSIAHPGVTVSGGVVSETKSFRMQHYVWITGVATNGEDEGVRDPLIELEHLRSQETQKQSDITGKFEVKLEVNEVGNERMFVTWKNIYRVPVLFSLPGKPETKKLGNIRLPINFISILVTDISGSTLRDVDVLVENASGIVQSLKTDQNGFCKTYDLPNGIYAIAVEKSGYRTERREIRVADGNVIPVQFTLPHYVMVRGTLKDIMRNPVSGADVIFEEFTDAVGQKLRTTTDALHGSFEQRLLIDDPKFLERQKGHFRIKKGEVEQLFTFKVPTEPNQVLDYKTLLFPTYYLRGKVVDSAVNTIPIDRAKISIVFVGNPGVGVEPQQSGLSDLTTETSSARETLRLTTDSLGMFEVGNLQEGEYKITIEKEGYVMREDFIRVSGLLQEQEFTLRKE